MRKVTRGDNRGKQAHILTTRYDLTPAEIVYRMRSRWRQENYFRYSRLHLDLHSHDTYTTNIEHSLTLAHIPLGELSPYQQVLDTETC